jgi:hypothetical protein
LNRIALLKKAGKAAMVCIGAGVVCASAAIAQRPTKPSPADQSMVLDSLDGLEIKAVSEKGAEAVKVKPDVAEYKGRRALHLCNDDTVIGSSGPSGGESLAIVQGSDFQDGSIEFDVVGMPRQGSNSQSRGFVGVAFRILR